MFKAGPKRWASIFYKILITDNTVGVPNNLLRPQKNI